MAARPKFVQLLEKAFDYIKGKFGHATVANTSDDQSGLPGHTLYHFPLILVFFIISLMAYATTIVVFMFYVMLNTPSQPSGDRVLWYGDYEVPSFYSQLALSVFFAPAAQLVRWFSSDIALLHPFALASKMPTAISDLDQLMNPGVEACYKLFNYSKRRAIVQSLIMIVGAWLVPVGALLMIPGTYNEPVHGGGVVGMPSKICQRSAFPTMDQNGQQGFSEPVKTVFRGRAFERLGQLPPLPLQLGPLQSENLTYVEGMRYRGIVTYTWNSGCEQSDRYQSFHTYPNTSEQYQTAYKNIKQSDIQKGKIAQSTTSITKTGEEDQTIPLENRHSVGVYKRDTDLIVLEAVHANGSDLTIFPSGVGWLVQFTGTNAKNRSNSTSVEWLMWGPYSQTYKRSSTTLPVNGSSDKFWIKSIRCTPTIQWQVSSCLWTNGSFTQCTPAPGQNTTELDVPALDGLQYHMGSIAETLIEDPRNVMGLNPLLLSLILDGRGTQYFGLRVPSITDFNNMYGFLAQSIVVVATQGPFGVANVPAEGLRPRPALLVRPSILIIVTIAMVLTPLLPTGVLYWDYRRHRMPFHRATLLTVTNATRGHWWDTTMYGTCVMKSGDLRRRLQGIDVMFGATLEEEPGEGKVPSQHVGLAPEVACVDDHETYYGFDKDI